jgi:hypothetical protein
MKLLALLLGATLMAAATGTANAGSTANDEWVVVESGSESAVAVVQWDGYQEPQGGTEQVAYAAALTLMDDYPDDLGRPYISGDDRVMLPAATTRGMEVATKLTEWGCCTNR